MWKSLKSSLIGCGVGIARGFVWWMEMLGRYPALSRDDGFLAWQQLDRLARQRERERERKAEEAELQSASGELIPKAGLNVSSGERARRKVTPLRSLRLRSRRSIHRRWRAADPESRELFLSR